MMRRIPATVAAAGAVLLPASCAETDPVKAETGCYVLSPAAGDSIELALSRAVIETLGIEDPISSPATPGFQSTIQSIRASLYAQYDEQVVITNLPRFDDVVGIKFTPTDALDFSRGGAFSMYEQGTVRASKVNETLPQDTISHLAKHAMIRVDCRTNDTIAVPKQ